MEVREKRGRGRWIVIACLSLDHVNCCQSLLLVHNHVTKTLLSFSSVPFFISAGFLSFKSFDVCSIVHSYAIVFSLSL